MNGSGVKNSSQVRWSLQRQIFVPFSLLVIAAVSITALASAWEAARRSNHENAQQLKGLVQTLSGTSFPNTASVLEKVKGLSRAEFAVLTTTGEVETTTFASQPASMQVPERLPPVDTIERITDVPLVQESGNRYFIAAVPTANTTDELRLLVFYPEQRWLQSRWQAVWPPLLVGAMSGLLAMLISGWLAHRFAARIRRVQQQLRQLAELEYVQVAVAPPHDELYELQSSANQLSARLAALQDEIVHTERVRLLAQIAGGLAHQLRNAVTGARMAVELHQRRCATGRTDESLDIALRQLSLTEEQIKGLLALGARRPQELRGGDLRQIVTSVASLVEPMCRHVQVEFHSSVALDEAHTGVHDADSLRAALLNLVLNAVEAAGPGGEVSLQVREEGNQVVASVSDTGAGPPASMANSLFDPFTTSKPEGVGLGLTLAQHTARHYGGSLQWQRANDRTVFSMRWPLPATEIHSTEAASGVLVTASQSNNHGTTDR